jgi:hypothetical protein
MTRDRSDDDNESVENTGVSDDDESVENTGVETIDDDNNEPVENTGVRRATEHERFTQAEEAGRIAAIQQQQQTQNQVHCSTGIRP